MSDTKINDIVYALLEIRKVQIFAEFVTHGANYSLVVFSPRRYDVGGSHYLSEDQLYTTYGEARTELLGFYRGQRIEARDALENAQAHYSNVDGWLDRVCDLPMEEPEKL